MYTLYLKRTVVIGKYMAKVLVVVSASQIKELYKVVANCLVSGIGLRPAIA